MNPFLRHLDVLFPPTMLGGDAAVDRTDWRPCKPGEYCGRCGSTVAAAAITESGCPHCREVRVAWHGLWRLGAYKPPLSEWIIDYKFRTSWTWGKWFGRELAARVPDYEKAIVVPVPLHWTRRLYRGYDQSLFIAEAFARSKRIKLTRLLRRVRRTKQQSHIHAQAERKKNVRKAFRIKDIDLTGYTVWLIDDVKTTGATAHACTRLLQRAGAERVNLAVAAVADPRGGDFQRN